MHLVLWYVVLVCHQYDVCEKYFDSVYVGGYGGLSESGLCVFCKLWPVCFLVLCLVHYICQSLETTSSFLPPSLLSICTLLLHLYNNLISSIYAFQLHQLCTPPWTSSHSPLSHFLSHIFSLTYNCPHVLYCFISTTCMSSSLLAIGHASAAYRNPSCSSIAGCHPFPPPHSFLARC